MSELKISEAGSVQFPMVGAHAAHELLHLRVAAHGRLFKALMSLHVPNWREFRCRASGHQAVPEFETTAQSMRLATSVGGVLTGRGADVIVIDDCSTKSQSAPRPS
jgi:hypothetical protein